MSTQIPSTGKGSQPPQMDDVEKWVVKGKRSTLSQKKKKTRGRQNMRGEGGRLAVRTPSSYNAIVKMQDPKVVLLRLGVSEPNKKKKLQDYQRWPRF